MLFLSRINAEVTESKICQILAWNLKPMMTWLSQNHSRKASKPLQVKKNIAPGNFSQSFKADSPWKVLKGIKHVEVSFAKAGSQHVPITPAATWTLRRFGTVSMEKNHEKSTSKLVPTETNPQLSASLMAHHSNKRTNEPTNQLTNKLKDGCGQNVYWIIWWSYQHILTIHYLASCLWHLVKPHVYIITQYHTSYKM